MTDLKPGEIAEREAIRLLRGRGFTVTKSALASSTPPTAADNARKAAEAMIEHLDRIAYRDSAQLRLHAGHFAYDNLAAALNAAPIAADGEREALERANRVFQFDLRKMLVMGDDYNQAVKDAADAVAAALAQPQPLAGDAWVGRATADINVYLWTHVGVSLSEDTVRQIAAKIAHHHSLAAAPAPSAGMLTEEESNAFVCMQADMDIWHKSLDARIAHNAETRLVSFRNTALLLAIIDRITGGAK